MYINMHALSIRTAVLLYILTRSVVAEVRVGSCQADVFILGTVANRFVKPEVHI